MMTLELFSGIRTNKMNPAKAVIMICGCGGHMTVLSVVFSILQHNRISFTLDIGLQWQLKMNCMAEISKIATFRQDIELYCTFCTIDGTHDDFNYIWSQYAIVKKHFLLFVLFLRASGFGLQPGKCFSHLA